jgi:hypothetical protein
MSAVLFWPLGPLGMAALYASDSHGSAMDSLTLFGLFAVTAMLVTYALEDRDRWFILAFAAACLLASLYGFLQGAWPFGVVEAIWAAVAVRRWQLRSSN